MPPIELLIVGLLTNLQYVLHLCTCPAHSADLLDYCVAQSDYGWPQ